MNRTEYANAVRDLIELPVDAEALLPGDDSVAGFDNIGSALSISPTLLQAYVSAAATLSRLAVGDPTASPTLTTYRAPRDWQSGNHVDGQPLGTRGGFQIQHVFPLDAEYEIRISARSEDEVELTLDGQRAALLPSAGRNARVATLAVPAGAHTLGVALIRRHDIEGVDDLFAVHAESSGIASFTVNGPLRASGIGDTPSRRRIFSCYPDGPAEETACAAEILGGLATRAYRRPVAADDAALATLTRFLCRGPCGELVRRRYSARFGALARRSGVYLSHRGRAGRAAGWDRLPRRATSISRRACRFSSGAASPTKRCSPRLPPGSCTSPPCSSARSAHARRPEVRCARHELRGAVAAATHGRHRVAGDQGVRRQSAPGAAQGNGALFSSVLREGRSVVDLLDADYTFVDERLARHYGLPNIRGSRFRRVELPPSSPRRGLLGQGSLLTLTSAPNRTSPVKRGQWVLNNLLGTPAPQPPDNVETNLEETAPAGEATTMRERLEQHQANPSCAMCHSLIDPLGFALENFDSIGAWRDTEAGRAVNAHGTFIDGSELDGVAGLRRLLLERRELFVAALTERLLTYALGRTLEPYDMPVVREIVRTAAKDDYRFSALVQGIVASEPMQFRMKLPGDEPQQARAD